MADFIVDKILTSNGIHQLLALFKPEPEASCLIVEWPLAPIFNLWIDKLTILSQVEGQFTPAPNLDAP